MVATRNEVLFDMVVTGRNGQVVLNLKPSQVEILDNGVPQKVTRFRLVARSVHLTPEEAIAQGTQNRPWTRPEVKAAFPAFNLVTLVCSSLDNGARILAGQAVFQAGFFSVE